MQDAFAAAVVSWRTEGIPGNPAAWITTTARRKLIDYARREQTRRNNEGQLLYEYESRSNAIDEEMSRPFEDDRLSLIFTCCHPALNLQAQVALTLRTLGGLTTPEIARAFLVPEPTLAQRLVRAQRKIQQARIPYQVPSPASLPERLAAVQAVLYLIFNEGYSASSGDNLIRRELCAEAIRLARTLVELMPDNPESMALLALMLLHDSRRDARSSPDGQLVPLEEQDRSLWRRDQIAEGIRLVERALGRRNVGPYQLQAAIAAVHAEAATAGETDWKQIAALYAHPQHNSTLTHRLAEPRGSHCHEREPGAGLSVDGWSGLFRRTRFLPSLPCCPCRPAASYGPQPGSTRELPPRARSHHQCSRASLSPPPYLRAGPTRVAASLHALISPQTGEPRYPLRRK